MVPGLHRPSNITAGTGEALRPVLALIRAWHRWFGLSHGPVVIPRKEGVHGVEEAKVR
jgi:hypothetical protein